MDVTHQIGVFLALTEGLIDEIPLDRISEAEEIIKKVVDGNELFQNMILDNEKLSSKIRKDFLEVVSVELKKGFE
jgi:F-type H+-transporting ATPase subunit alpha